MVDALRKCIQLIDRRSRSRWIGLIVFAAVVSVFEAGAALVIYAVLSYITSEQAELSLPGIGDLFERFPDAEQNDVVTAFSIAAVVFFVVRAAVFLVQSYAQNRIAHDATASLASRLLAGYLSMPYGRFVRRSSAELIRNAHESSHLLAMHVFVPVVVLASEAMLQLAILVVLFATEPGVTLVALVAIAPIVVLLTRAIQPPLVARGRVAHDSSRDSLQSLQQSLQGRREITVRGREAFFEAAFRRTRYDLARVYAARAVLIDVPRVVLETIVVLFLLVFILVATLTERSTADVLAALGLFGYAVMRSLPSLNRVLASVSSLKFSRPLIESLHEDLMATEAERAAAAEGGPDITFERAIELRDVRYRYEGAETDALVVPELRIARGEAIGIVGPTGGGKSTLVDLVIALLVPTEGCVLVDGVDVATSPRAWQRRLGVVPQSIFLLDDTVRRNIAIGVPDDEIDEDAVVRAARAAQLDFVDELPDAFDAMVGERGVRLSGGQRQRLAIARALYSHPEVLLFDEGTSALDNATEADVMDAIESLRGELTLIVVAHRLSTVRRCDRVVVLEAGRITGEGTYDELLGHSDAFRRLATGERHDEQS